MNKEIFAVIETVQFVRVRNFSKGYKGKYAVCEGLSKGKPCKIMVAEEEFPLKILNKIDKGTYLKVKANERGLRAAKIEYQDLEIIKLNQENIAVELANIKINLKNSEQRTIERDNMLFKWMDEVDKELHLLGLDLNKFREIFFKATKDEDDE